ncbi:MAG: guanylate kinase, partial [Oscillospiraceae bacterium]
SDALMIFVMPPSFGELRRRLLGRGTETEDQMNTRLSIALGEIAHATEYDYIIVNDELERARAELLEAIHAGRLLSRYHTKLINEVLKRC